MLYEIQSGTFLCEPELPDLLTEATLQDDLVGIPLKFNFQHDLESLWWIMLCVLTCGVDHKQFQDFASTVFINPLHLGYMCSQHSGQIISSMKLLARLGNT